MRKSGAWLYRPHSNCSGTTVAAKREPPVVNADAGLSPQWRLVGDRPEDPTSSRIKSEGVANSPLPLHVFTVPLAPRNLRRAVCNYVALAINDGFVTENEAIFPSLTTASS